MPKFMEDETINGSPTGEPSEQLRERVSNRVSRRNFFASAGMVAGAVAVVGCGGSGSTTTTPTTTPPTTTTTPATPAPTELDVLNFALNLEYLEATFYLNIATGSGLPSSLTGASPGAVTGASGAVKFTDPNVAALAMQLAQDEQAHVTFIRSLITMAGSTPVDMPALNIAALGAVTDDASFLMIARAMETVGTSAYDGGAQYFVADTIHDTEAQHEGNLRQFCIAKGLTSPAVDANDRPPTATQVFNTDANGLNTVRTPSQVLQIVYAAAGKTGVSSGGFYPNGLNGTIKTT